MSIRLSFPALAACFAAALASAAVDDKAPLNMPPPGFVALFNGKDLTGWQAAIPINKRLKSSPQDLAAVQKAADDKVLPHWKVEDGVLVNDGHGGSLATARDFGNFELFLDWKIEPKGDSGLYLRGNPQVQIWDSDTLNPQRYVAEFGKGSGALWNNRNKKDKVPLKKADRAAGEWNTFHIVMKGDKVTVKLNGELVVDNVALDNYWDKGQPLPARGPLELQQHNKQDGTPGKLWFRNIYLKELAD
jgi:hypothetical protein